jgi:hypothetical protein
MMTEAPREKAGFHFPGHNAWENMYIWAHSIEDATKVWLKTRKPLNPLEAPIVDAPLSTPAPAPTEEGVQ